MFCALEIREPAPLAALMQETPYFSESTSRMMSKFDRPFPVWASLAGSKTAYSNSRRWPLTVGSMKDCPICLAKSSEPIRQSFLELTSMDVDCRFDEGLPDLLGEIFRAHVVLGEFAYLVHAAFGPFRRGFRDEVETGCGPRSHVAVIHSDEVFVPPVLAGQGVRDFVVRLQDLEVGAR